MEEEEEEEEIMIIIEMRLTLLPEVGILIP